MKTNKLSLSLMPSEVLKEDKVLDSVAARTSAQAEQKSKLYPYTLVGTIEKVFNNGTAKVIFDLEEHQYGYMAITTHPLKREDENKKCVLTFNKGDISQPIITGIVQPTHTEPAVISSEEGIVLECGETRIVLDPDGTLELKARYIHSQAYGPYRIKGASVKIN